jgi:hypothetical protein
MTELPPSLAKIGRVAKTEKIRSVRHDDGQIMHYADVYRGGKCLLSIAVPQPDNLVGLLQNAPGAMTADYVAIAADAWGATGGTNPITGQEWGRGDMDRIAQHDLGVHRGILREHIMVMGFERAGSEVLHLMHYEHDRENGRITWPETSTSTEGIDGRFPDAARFGFGRPTIVEIATGLLGPLPDDLPEDEFIDKAAVSWVLEVARQDEAVILRGPKGPPLAEGPLTRAARQQSG